MPLWRKLVKSSLRENPALERSVGDDRISLLKGCALFSALDEPELRELALSATLVQAGEGVTLFRQGEPGETLYIIVSGTVRLSWTTELGFEQPIAVHGASSCFGEMAVLDGEPRSATAVVVRPTMLLRVDRGDLEEAFQRHPSLRERFLRQSIRMISSRLRSANESYWRLAGRSLRARAEAAQARSRLAALMSHEFRTPLTVIKSSAQRMRFRAPNAEDSLIERIVRQCARLEVLVEDLIALALLQSTTALQELADVDLSEVAAEVGVEMSGPARQKGLWLSLKSESGLPVVVADRFLVRRALRHLVDNAVKFSSEGEIVIETGLGADGLCRLSVRDNGIGIDPLDLERLSSTFIQDQDPHNRAVEGLGIGLALVREIARSHGGRLMVQSFRGAGSHFVIELPPKPSETPDALPDPEKRSDGDE